MMVSEGLASDFGYTAIIVFKELKFRGDGSDV